MHQNQPAAHAGSTRYTCGQQPCAQKPSRVMLQVEGRTHLVSGQPKRHGATGSYPCQPVHQPPTNQNRIAQLHAISAASTPRNTMPCMLMCNSNTQPTSKMSCTLGIWFSSSMCVMAAILSCTRPVFRACCLEQTSSVEHTQSTPICLYQRWQLFSTSCQCRYEEPTVFPSSHPTSPVRTPVRSPIPQFAPTTAEL